MTKFLIVDGNSLGCRAAFAAPKNKPDLYSSAGVPTGTQLRFLRLFNYIMMDIKPTHIVVAWDTPGETFRKQIYPLYKANRHKVIDKETCTTEEYLAFQKEMTDMTIMFKQFKMIRIMLDILGIKNVSVKGYEGDDICGTFSHISEADKTYIATGDQDNFQLISDDVFIVYPKHGFMKADIVDEQYVYDKFGVEVEEFKDFKALQGDKGDNIPGLVGCGPKTAAKLIQRYKKADIIASLKEDELECSQKVKNNFNKWKEEYDIIKQLIEIKLDVPVNCTFDDCKIGLLNWKALSKYISTLDMKSLVDQIAWGAVYRKRY